MTRSDSPPPRRTSQDAVFMRRALAQASLAARAGDVPVGAVVVHQGKIIAEAHNERKIRKDPTAHAEILALQEASRVLGSWHLEECTLYVTLEPCAMCAGAAVAARLGRLVYGAADPKAGAVRSLYAVCEDPRLNHNPVVVPGVLAQQAGALLTQFFDELRRNAKGKSPETD